MEIPQDLGAIDVEPFDLQLSADTFGPSTDSGITRKLVDTREGVIPGAPALRENHAR